MADSATGPDPRIPVTDPSPSPEHPVAGDDARAVAPPRRRAAPAGRRVVVVLAFPSVSLGILTLLHLNGSAISLG